jgi:histone H3/H4
MQIKELTTEQFRSLIRETVMEVLEEYIDLDEGKKLKTSVVERLVRQQHQQAINIPAAQAMQTLGINWNEL